MELSPIGVVESPLTDPASAPKQGREGAPEAWLAIRPEVAQVVEIDGARLRVRDLEAVDGTPVLDLKPVI